MSLIINHDLTLGVILGDVIEHVAFNETLTEGNPIDLQSLTFTRGPITLVISTEKCVPDRLLSRMRNISSVVYYTSNIPIQRFDVNEIVLKCMKVDMSHMVSQMVDLIKGSIIRTKSLVIEMEEFSLSDDVNCGGYCLNRRIAELPHVTYRNIHNPFDDRSSPASSIVIKEELRRPSPVCAAFVPCVCYNNQQMFFFSCEEDIGIDIEENVIPASDLQRLRMFAHPCLSTNCMSSAPKERRQLLR